MIRDAVDAVDVYLDCMQSSTLQSVQSLVSISHANSDKRESAYVEYFSLAVDTSDTPVSGYPSIGRYYRRYPDTYPIL